MNLRAAEDAIREWERRLAKAQAELAQFQDDLGMLALRGEAGKTTAKLTALQNEVSIAEAALAAAHRQKEVVRDEEDRARIADLQRQVAEAKQVAAEQAAYLAEHQPAVEAARRKFESETQRYIHIEHQIEDMQFRLRQRERKRAEAPRQPEPVGLPSGPNNWGSFASGLADSRSAAYEPHPARGE